MNQEEMFANVCNEQIICARNEHSTKMAILIEQQEMNLFIMLKPSVNICNGKWTVAYNNILFGEGETLMKAIFDFNKQFTSNP